MTNKIAGAVIICAAIAFLFPVVVPAPTYTYVVKELTNTFTAVQNFAFGLTATAGDITATTGDIVATNGDIVADVGDIEATAGNVKVAAGSRIILDSTSAENYSTFDADTNCVRYYSDNTLSMEICPGYFRVFCTSDRLENAPGGAMCWDTSTGRIITKDSRAVYSQ